MQRKFNCPQQTLVMVLLQLWDNCLANLTAMSAYKSLYTTTFINSMKTAVSNAALLPDNDARRTVAESIRIDMVAQSKICRNLWQDLKSYIRSAYPADQYDTMLTQAGWNYYSRSASNWSALQSLMTSGLNFINANSTTLTDAGYMREDFALEFANSIGSFNSLFSQFVTALQTAEQGTDERLEALNNCYEQGISMCLDGQNVFRNNEATKNLFVFEHVCGLVAGTSPATLDGYVMYEINGEPVVGMTAEIVQLNKSVQTNEEGFYDFGPVKGGTTYTVKYLLDGEVKDTEEVTVHVGTGARKNVEIE